MAKKGRGELSVKIGRLFEGHAREPGPIRALVFMALTTMLMHRLFWLGAVTAIGLVVSCSG